MARGIGEEAERWERKKRRGKREEEERGVRRRERKKWRANNNKLVGARQNILPFTWWLLPMQVAFHPP